MDKYTTSKLLSLHCNNAEIITSGTMDSFDVTLNEMPDVLAYDKSVNRLYIINNTNLESRNTKAYVNVMEAQFLKCQLERIYIFVYPSRHEYGKKANELVWGTHIWCIDEPDHMIHLN